MCALEKKKIACRVVEIHGTRETNGGMCGAIVIGEIVGFQNQALGILQVVVEVPDHFPCTWDEDEARGGEGEGRERAPVPHRDDLKRLAAAQVYL